MKKKLIIRGLTAALALALAPASLAEPREVRIASHVSALSPLHQQSEMFAAEVERRLPGQFKFQLFPSGQLGKEKALITNVKAGALEMINVASGILKLDKKLGLFDLPWLFTDRAHVRRAMAAGLEDAIRAHIGEVAGVKVVGVYENGFRHVINTKRAVRTPDDLHGLKIRISGGKFRQNVFQQLGAAPQSVAWAETFTALQTGVVDGAEAATYGFYEQKHYEVAKHMSLTRHVYTPSFLLASRSFWDGLTEEQRRAFEEAGRAITDRAYEMADQLEVRYLEEMRKNLSVNEAELPDFQRATAQSYENYAADQGREWLDMARASADK